MNYYYNTVDSYRDYYDDEVSGNDDLDRYYRKLMDWLSNPKSMVYVQILNFVLVILSFYALYSLFRFLFNFGRTILQLTLTILTSKRNFSLFLLSSVIPLWAILVNFDGNEEFSIWIREHYNWFITETINQTLGINLADSKFTQTEQTILGTVLFVAIVYFIIFKYFRLFYRQHRLVGLLLVLIGAYLYLHRFPITTETERFYRSNWFVIDTKLNGAYLRPSLIPKILFILVGLFFLGQSFFNLIRWCIRFSIRLFFLSLAAILLLNCLVSLMNQRTAESSLSGHHPHHSQSSRIVTIPSNSNSNYSSHKF